MVTLSVTSITLKLFQIEIFLLKKYRGTFNFIDFSYLLMKYLYITIAVENFN